MPSVLSTKPLSPSQKQLLLNAGLSYTEYNFIQTKAINLALSTSEETQPNAIVTSQRTVDFIKDFKIERCFCVGKKTALKLAANGFHVECIADNGKALAEEIIRNYKGISFTFFGSTKRRPELSERLASENVDLNEIFVYDTLKSPKTFSRTFDAVLCFSPMGVDSFFEGNPSSSSQLICIGITTARQAKIYTDAVLVSSKTSIESVIVKAVKALKA